MDQDLLSFLSLEFPATSHRHDTFLDIAGLSYHENTISRIYAYFLNYQAKPEIANLFQSALMNIINSKLTNQADLTMVNPWCYLESTTSKGRIDMLIRSHKDDGEIDTGEESVAIIIENKIYHGLGNDLDEYYEHTKAAIKQGVLLTLNKAQIHPQLQSKYVNLTHSEWIDQIRQLGFPSTIAHNELIYINDFLNNMDYLSNNSKMTEEVDFFFSHQNKILRALQVYDVARTYVVSQFKIVAEKLEWDFYGNHGDWRHLWDKNGFAQVYYAVVFNNFLSTNELTIYLEVYKESRAEAEDFRRELDQRNLYNSNFKKNSEKNNSWERLGKVTYVYTKAELANLSEVLYEQIQRDLQPAYNYIYDIAPRNNGTIGGGRFK